MPLKKRIQHPRTKSSLPALFRRIGLCLGLGISRNTRQCYCIHSYSFSQTTSRSRTILYKMQGQSREGTLKEGTIIQEPGLHTLGNTQVCVWKHRFHPRQNFFFANRSSSSQRKFHQYAFRHHFRVCSDGHGGVGSDLPRTRE